MHGFLSLNEMKASLPHSLPRKAMMITDILEDIHRQESGKNISFRWPSDETTHGQQIHRIAGTYDLFPGTAHLSRLLSIQVLTGTSLTESGFLYRTLTIYTFPHQRNLLQSLDREGSARRHSGFTPMVSNTSQIVSASKFGFSCTIMCPTPLTRVTEATYRPCDASMRQSWK